jgi:hypothetical protein
MNQAAVALHVETLSLDSPQSSPGSSQASRALPTGIWALGFVSMLMDISCELIHSLLPVFMATVLGASMTTIGLVEGIAEGTAAITKVFSGAASDYRGKRKLLAVLGYGLGSLTKPVFPLASTIGWVLAGRFIDRVGKGIRGAPRDALVADIAPPEMWGAAYGLRQSLDSVGALLGPLLAVGFMAWLANDIRTVLWVAVAPAFLSVVLLVAGVREPERAEARPGAHRPLTLTDAKRLPPKYWFVVLLGAVFTIGRRRSGLTAAPVCRMFEFAIFNWRSIEPRIPLGTGAIQTGGTGDPQFYQGHSRSRHSRLVHTSSGRWTSMVITGGFVRSALR